MKIIIYNPNSFGGNYEYAHSILNEYTKKVYDCKLILPSNSNKTPESHRRLILLSDIPQTSNTLLKKLYFIFRSLINPIIFFWVLCKAKKSIVIFNDFDQLTAFVWVPFYHLLKIKHRFAVILHDPDRDAYFPTPWLSGYSMRCIMSLMQWGMYHEFLPDKWYYKNKVKYFAIPHGIYASNKNIDTELSTLLQDLKNHKNLFTILGNIRKEKNYEMAIEALQKCEHIQLIIAGKNANSSYTIEHLKAIAKKHNVQDKITWINKYLSDREMNSILENTDVLLLNYSNTFSSQSGVLNLAAPFKPNLLVSKTNSALYKTCKKFSLAEFIPADDAQALEKKFIEWDKHQKTQNTNWDDYLAYASWENNINTMLKQFRIS